MNGWRAPDGPYPKDWRPGGPEYPREWRPGGPEWPKDWREGGPIEWMWLFGNLDPNGIVENNKDF